MLIIIRKKRKFNFEYFVPLNGATKLLVSSASEVGPANGSTSFTMTFANQQLYVGYDIFNFAVGLMGSVQFIYKIQFVFGFGSVSKIRVLGKNWFELYYFL